VFDAVVGAVLGTRVQVEMARRSLVLLAARNGEPAPGPWPQLRVMPSPARLAGLTYPELHRCGIERSRADVLRRVAAETPRLEAAAETGSEPLRRRLLSLTGIGPWTTAGVLAETFGDPDAVLLGDYHVPHLVCWALAREPRGSDERMLELLEPYAGQRARVIALLLKAGWRAPRRGPRLSFQPVDRYDGSVPDAGSFSSRRRSQGQMRPGGRWNG
jgi:3-methyladenine DNA glycosylase/8-oxoguanine DNA glycosylase